MNKVYEPINWQNEKEGGTALNASNLNKMDVALNEIDNRVIELNENADDTDYLVSTSVRTASKEISGAEFYVLKSGYYRLASAGSVVNPDKIYKDNTMMCVKAPFAEGEQITINGDGTSGIARLYAFVDKDNIVLYLSSNYLTGKRTITAPANCAYVLINILSSSENPFVYKGTLSSIETNERLQVIDDSVSYVTKDFVQGAISSLGDEGSSSVYCRTDFIGIEKIKRVFKPSGELSVLVCLYDSDKIFIDRITSDSPNKFIDYDRTEVMSAWGSSGKTKYVRFSIKRTVEGAEVNSTPTDIINSELKIELYGVSESIYDRVFALEKENESAGVEVPGYYSEHLLNKVNTINGISDTIGTVNDNFIFLSDYHWQSNAGNSISLIKHIVANTGITKMFFGGDAGKSSIESDKYGASRLDAEIYNKLWQCVPNFYGVLGNHEWNDRQDETHEASQQSKVYSRAGVVNFYIRREQKLVESISNEGNYYVDNAGSKIRYIFIQCTGQARVTNETCQWLIEQLNNVPEGYHVILVSHAVYDGWSHGSNHEQYYGDRCRMSVIRLSQIMGAYKTKSAGSVNQLADYFDASGTSPYITGSINYDFTKANGSPICIVGGHNHKDAHRTESGVLIIQTTTDAYDANDDVNVIREIGTTTEQAFDIFHVDITNRKIYATRIGGGFDREFSF